MSTLALLDLGHRISRWISSIGCRTLIIGATGIGLCVPVTDATAQSPPSTRPYQMSILASTGSVSSAGSDLPIFTQNAFSNYQTQPAGRSIAWLPPSADLDQHNIDWNRIVGVYVDEPYIHLVENNTSCSAPGVAAVRQALQDMAAALRARAPKARFWVNFSKTEIEMIRDGCDFNGSYIDVISMDIYEVDFFDSALVELYEYVYGHRASVYQQLALVPGTFTHYYSIPAINTFMADQQASLLSGFFEYADLKNQSCDLPLGPTGVTGIYDGCPVWIVAGWTGGVDGPGDAPNYLPIDNPNSEPVFDAWQTAFAIRRIDPTNVRRARDLVPSLLLLQE